MQENKYYSRNNLISAFLIGILAGFGVYSMWDNSSAVRGIVGQEKDTGGAAMEETPLDENSVAMELEHSGENTISVVDQPAGLKVIIESATLAEQGWVVIHEDRDGAPGNILGAQRFEPGTSAGEVELLRNTVEGGLYYAMLHGDDGDGQFDYTKDLAIMENDAPVMVTFNAVRIR